MEETKKNQGPESPADLERSQGAKNPRKETNTDNDDDTIDMFKIGTLLGDTDDDDDKDIDNVPLILKEAETSKDDINKKDEADGTPSGDTAARSNKSKKRRANDDKGFKLQKKPKIASAIDFSKRELERRDYIENKQRQKGTFKYNVHERIYANFLKSLENPEALEKDHKIREYFVTCIKKLPTLYEAFRKEPNCAIFCQHHNDGSVSRTQARFIQEKLMDYIVDYYQTYRNDVVKFEDCAFEQSHFRVICADDFSLLFLKSLGMKSVWPGSPEISVITNIDFADLLKVNVTLVKDRFKDFHKDFLKLIVFQNRDIDTRRWALKKKDVHAKTETWLLEIDRVSVQKIFSLGGRLYCGVHYVQFHCSEKFP